jgi:hypothetical protein
VKGLAVKEHVEAHALERNRVPSDQGEGCSFQLLRIGCQARQVVDTGCLRRIMKHEDEYGGRIIRGENMIGQSLVLCWRSQAHYQVAH